MKAASRELALAAGQSDSGRVADVLPFVSRMPMSPLFVPEILWTRGQLTFGRARCVRNKRWLLLLGARICSFKNGD